MALDNTSPVTSLRFAINLGNPVLAQQQPDGTLTGITRILAEQLAASLHCRADFICYDTAGKVVDDAVAGRWDIAFLAIDPLRAAVLRYTDPYLIIEGTLMVPVGSDITRVSQMDSAGNRINVGLGAAYDLFLSRHLRQAGLQRFGSSQQAIDKFLAGEGDMVAGIRQVLEQYAARDGRYRVLPDSFTDIRQAICVPHNSPLYDALAGQLALWQQDGRLALWIEQNISAN
ncbi:transporter substrate-binding domain-containing protein [Shimwellia pseudoproteus]|uniref:transporter substrate-binding domain-containing protein n=1 Tax=Shimwellia pseudoproteus TaxID=570012 RepID=UPI0018EBA668|nr:transporter substrate-binding domain-containing protein [Shimwellia pseudoproteus]MBJ3815611.1 transporter substrate-binding domain-containing protein [Shimwellia pseudoproteus]